MPKEWRIGSFSNIISSISSGDWGKESKIGNYIEPVHCIRGADLPEISLGNKGKIPTRYILTKNLLAKQLSHNDIVVEISGGSPTQATGRSVLITQSLLDSFNHKMICTNFCRVITPRKDYAEFMFYYWQYLYNTNSMFLYENGTTGIKNFDITNFIEVEKIIIPDIEEIQRFSDIIQKIKSNIASNGLECEKLAVMRDTLLPKLLSGEISVNQTAK